MTQKKKKEEVFCQKALAALNGTNCLSVPSGRRKGLTLLSVFTGPWPFHWPKARRVCMKLTWMSSKPGHVLNCPGLRLYSLGSNNVSTLTLILKRGICDLYYTINQCIYSTRSAFLILNFYLAELIITVYVATDRNLQALHYISCKELFYCAICDVKSFSNHPPQPF